MTASRRKNISTISSQVRTRDEPSALTSQPCSDLSNPNKVRPISGGSKSCALNSLDMALSLDDQVHAPAPKLRKNLKRTKELPRFPAFPAVLRGHFHCNLVRSHKALAAPVKAANLDRVLAWLAKIAEPTHIDPVNSGFARPQRQRART